MGVKIRLIRRAQAAPVARPDASPFPSEQRRIRKAIRESETWLFQEINRLQQGAFYLGATYARELEAMENLDAQDIYEIIRDEAGRRYPG